MVEAGMLGGHLQNQSNLSYKPLPQIGLKKHLSSYKLLASCFKREFNCQNPAVSIQLPNSQLPGTQTPANLITSLQTHTHTHKYNFFFKFSLVLGKVMSIQSIQNLRWVSKGFRPGLRESTEVNSLSLDVPDYRQHAFSHTLVPPPRPLTSPISSLFVRSCHLCKGSRDLPIL